MLVGSKYLNILIKKGRMVMQGCMRASSSILTAAAAAFVAAAATEKKRTMRTTTMMTETATPEHPIFLQP